MLIIIFSIKILQNVLKFDDFWHNRDQTGWNLHSESIPDTPGAQNGLPDQFKTILKSYQKSYIFLYFSADYCIPLEAS